jgi:hypothetical protein
LAVLHEGIAVVTKTPEMSLDESEAKMLATATVPVLEQFNIAPDPRFAAAFALIAACGTVYVPRAVLIRARLAAEADARRVNAMRNVTPTPTAQPEPDLSGMNNGGFFGGTPN